MKPTIIEARWQEQATVQIHWPLLNTFDYLNNMHPKIRKNNICLSFLFELTNNRDRAIYFFKFFI